MIGPVAALVHSVSPNEVMDALLGWFVVLSAIVQPLVLTHLHVRTKKSERVLRKIAPGAVREEEER